MYERFYGLARTPFAVTPDPAMLFMSKVHREALATVLYGIETRKGFIVCTGEVGTGKSTIVRAVFDQVRPQSVKLIYIFTPQVSPLEMAQYICGELGVAPQESVFAAVPPLQLRLLAEFESSRTVVLMIDEAQLLPPETLEFLRLLSNFETDTEKLIQIVLVGQPEVDTMLARPDMRQVAQRVALRARLAALGLEESFDYIDHRLRVSGAGDLAQVMTPSAAWLIAEAAGGIPRTINILADNALIAGFGAAQRPVGSQIAGDAVGEFLAKSGPAAPARGDRFAAGRRVARRLRSALMRERGEAAEFVARAPAVGGAPDDRPTVAERRAAAGVPATYREGGRDGPREGGVPAAGAAVTEPPPHAADAEGVTSAALVAASAVSAATDEARGAPAVPAKPASVEPVAQPPERCGLPVSTAGMILVEPVVPPLDDRDAPAEAAAIATGAEPTLRPPHWPAERVTAAAAPRNLGGSPEWPALARIRTGLYGAPSRTRGLADGSD